MNDYKDLNIRGPTKRIQQAQRWRDLLTLRDAFQRCRQYMTPTMKRELFAIITILEDSNPALPSPDRPAQDTHERATCQTGPHPELKNAWKALEEAKDARDRVIATQPRTTPPGARQHG